MYLFFLNKNYIFLPLFLNIDGTREICLSEEFFTDFGKTALRPDEILLAIDISHSTPVYTSKWRKLSLLNITKLCQVSTNRLGPKRLLVFAFPSILIFFKPQICYEFTCHFEKLNTNPCIFQWEFVSTFRQAQRREFAFSIVNAGMRVSFSHDSNVVEHLDIFYGGVGPTLVKARHTCKELMGRYSYRKAYIIYIRKSCICKNRLSTVLTNTLAEKKSQLCKI